MPRKPIRAPKRARDLEVSDTDYAVMLAAQNGVCAICHGKPKRLKKDGTPYRFAVDHARPSKRVRGLLCFRCNHALRPYMTESWLLRAAVYVREPQP